MAPTRIPYQCLERCGRFIVGANGSVIDLFDVKDGSLLSTWHCPTSSKGFKEESVSQASQPDLKIEDSKSSSVDIKVESSPRPTKRRKLSGGGDENEDPAETPNDNKKEGKNMDKKERKQNNRSESVASGLKAPAVIALAVTSDDRHVIAITGEDKSIRVFSLICQDGIAKLEQLSQR